MSRLLIIAALLLPFGTANAQQRTLEPLENGLESSLAGVNLPTDVGGTVTLKGCADCAYSTHRTTEATAFHANGEALLLADFLRVVEEIYQRPGTAQDDVLVTVFLDIATDRVTRVALRY